MLDLAYSTCCNVAYGGSGRIVAVGRSVSQRFVVREDRLDNCAEYL